MATTTTPPTGGPDPRRCPNAEEFVRRRLDQADGPLSPAELAEEYGCTQVHMRAVMADLASEREIRRVTRGQYVAEPDDDLPADPTDEDTEEPVESDAVDEQDSTESTADATGEELPDPMPTPDEYERQHTGDDGGATDEDTEEPTGGDDGATDVSPDENTASDDADLDEDVAAVAGAAGAVDPRTFLTVLAVAAVAYLCYQAMTASGGDATAADVDGGADAPDQSANGGGLVQ